jgi:hypothetical protein
MSIFLVLMKVKVLTFVKSLNSILEAPELVRQARLPPSSYVYFHWRRPTPRHLAAAAFTTTATRYSAPQVDLQSSTGIPTAANGNSVIILNKKSLAKAPPNTSKQDGLLQCSDLVFCLYLFSGSGRPFGHFIFY